MCVTRSTYAIHNKMLLGAQVLLHFILLIFTDSFPDAEVTERTTAHTVDSLLKVEYVDITNTSHIEAPDTPVTPASTASTLGMQAVLFERDM